MRALLSVVAALFVLIWAPTYAFAGDAASGARVFSSNCAACHAGGGNIVNAEHTLQQDDLKSYLAQYNNGHESAIVAQVTYGLNEMPAAANCGMSSRPAEPARCLAARRDARAICEKHRCRAGPPVR